MITVPITHDAKADWNWIVDCTKNGLGYSSNVGRAEELDIFDGACAG